MSRVNYINFNKLLKNRMRKSSIFSTLVIFALGMIMIPCRLVSLLKVIFVQQISILVFVFVLEIIAHGLVAFLYNY